MAKRNREREKGAGDGRRKEGRSILRRRIRRESQGGGQAQRVAEVRQKP